jgi:hypothetical protein
VTEPASEKVQPKIRIPHSAIVRASGLLPMYYTAGELSAELEVPRKTIILWVKNGLPHMRDKQNHVWVVGSECAVWIEAMRKANLKKIPLGDEEAFCFRCRKPVEIQDRHIQTIRGRYLLSGKCPECGCRVNKGVRLDKPE